MYPPKGAGLPSATVPVELFPPVTDEGTSVRDENVGAAIVRVAVWALPLNPAITLTKVCMETGSVFIENDADVLPTGTTTLAGTLTDFRFADTDTTIPSVGAGAFSCTVAAEFAPPFTLVGTRTIDETDGGFTVISVA